VIGGLALVGGLLMLVNPDLIRDLTNAFMLNRSRSFQTFMMWVSGIVRIGIAGAMFYALIVRPTATTDQPSRAQPGV